MREGAIQPMAQRAREKAKRPAAGRTSRARTRQPAAAAEASGPEARVKALEQERDSLKAELDAARKRIAALEESRNVVASRIDWVIESLNGVVDKGG